MLGAGLDGEIQLCREPHRAQHAHRIFAVARLGIADELQAARSYIAHPVDKVPDRKVVDVVVDPVRRKVAPPHILFDGPVDVVSQDAPGGVEGAVRGIVRGGRCRSRRGLLVPVVLGILALRRSSSAKGSHFDDFLTEVHMR